MLKKLSFPLVSLSLLLSSAGLQAGHLDDLPEETVLHIISFLPTPKDVASFDQTSIRNHALSRDNQIWPGLLTPNMREVADALKEDSEAKKVPFSFYNFCKENIQDPILFLIDNQLDHSPDAEFIAEFAYGELQQQYYTIQAPHIMRGLLFTYPIMTSKLTSRMAIGGHFYIFRHSHFNGNHPHYLQNIKWKSSYPEKKCLIETSKPSIDLEWRDHDLMTDTTYGKVVLTKLPSRPVFCENLLPSNLPATRPMTLEEKESYAQSHPNLSNEELEKYKMFTPFALTIFPDYLPVHKINDTKESL